jgi:D-alanine-D-alanine ligase
MNITILHSADALDPRDPVLDQIGDALRAGGHDPRFLAIDASIEPVTAELTTNRPDLVFNLAESFGGKSALESNVAALLNLIGLRYTGSSPSGLLLAGDKALSKMILGFHRIRTPAFVTSFRGTVEWAQEVRFPLIVKPPQEDASLGISGKSVVHDVKELLERVAELQREFQQPALIEEFVEGREFYVGVIGNESARALPPIELDFSKFPEGRPRIASWEAKWGDEGAGEGEEFAGTESVFPSDLTDELRDRLQETAVAAFKALRLRDYGRIDLRVSAEGEVHVIEVNPNCYLEANGEFARAAAHDGLEYDALISRIVELASARYAR